MLYLFINNLNRYTLLVIFLFLCFCVCRSMFTDTETMSKYYDTYFIIYEYFIFYTYESLFFVMFRLSNLKHKKKKQK